MNQPAAVEAKKIIDEVNELVKRKAVLITALTAADLKASSEGVTLRYGWVECKGGPRIECYGRDGGVV
jgi:hypothetical protein